MNDRQDRNERIERLQSILDSEIEAGQNAEAVLADLEGTADPGMMTPVDLATLLSEMAALRSEIRKETQAARLLRDDNEQSVVELGKALHQAEVRYQTVVHKQGDVRKKAAVETINTLIDIVDRLEPTLASLQKMAEPQRRGFWSAKKTDPLAEGLAEGLSITLRNIRVKLKEMGVERFQVRGRIFDPLSMEAVGKELTDGGTEGVVIREVLPGYGYEGGTFRAAKVIVGRNQKE